MLRPSWRRPLRGAVGRFPPPDADPIGMLSSPPARVIFRPPTQGGEGWHLSGGV